MRIKGKRPQMSRQLELPWEGLGEAQKNLRSEEAPWATHGNECSGASDLMTKVLKRRNLQAALKRVKKNKGSAGIDGMTVGELPIIYESTGSKSASNCSQGRTSPRQ